MYASHEGDTEMAELLLKHKADPNKKSAVSRRNTVQTIKIYVVF